MLLKVPTWTARLAAICILGIAGCGATDTAAPSEIVVDAIAHGVIGDGTTLNTFAIQAAIDSLSASGGGVLSFPAGRYLTGTIQLKNNVCLRLADDAVLLGSLNAGDYQNLDPFTSGNGAPFGYAMVIAMDATRVGIEGAGTIDGDGKALKAAEGDYTIRPFLIRWVRCTDVTVRDVHLTDPGAWTMHFFQCANVLASHVTIRSAESHLANNDGIDIDSCQHARITDCDIESGDDAICMKATSPLPCRDLVITGCSLKTRCNAIKFGTESLGDFTDIHAGHCRMRDVGLAGVALYSVDGAQLHDITLTDLDMIGVSVPISVRLGARLKTFRSGDQPRPIGTLHDITIENVRAAGVRQIGLLVNGIPNHPVTAIHLKNIDIALAGGGKAEDADVQLPEREAAYPEITTFGKVMPAYGVYLRHVDGMTCDHVTLSVVRPDPRPPVILIDVHGVTAGDFPAASSGG